jgi:hypothetical protein
VASLKPMNGFGSRRAAATLIRSAIRYAPFPPRVTKIPRIAGSLKALVGENLDSIATAAGWCLPSLDGAIHRLMKAAESGRVARGARVLVVTSGNHRAGAHAFYESCGYSFTGRRYRKSATWAAEHAAAADDHAE